VKLSPLTKVIGSSAVGLSIFTATLIRKRKSRNGPATALTVRILQGLTLTMEVLSRLFRAVNLGGEVTADATVHLQYRYDRESARTESTERVAI